MVTISKGMKVRYNLISVGQINARHNFLARFIGTFPKEDVSYSKANEVQLAVTVTTCTCCILEIGLYFFYNRLVNNKQANVYNSNFIISFVQVHPWLPIISGGAAETKEEEDLRLKEEEEKEKKKKEEKKRKKQEKKKEKERKKEIKNQHQEEQVGEAMKMDEMGED